MFGRFEDMLLAVERHPAMLLYLDQARSIGPAASRRSAPRAADPQRRRGLNENLAREILELHTLGVRSGYSQADVTEFARALTGWSVGGAGRPVRVAPGSSAGRFDLRVAALHEPGSRTRARRALRATRAKAQARGDPARPRGRAGDRAAHRHQAGAPFRRPTSRRRRWWSALAERLRAQRAATCRRVYRALIESPEAWAAAPAKFKTPWEWTLSSLRGLGCARPAGQQIAPMLNQLGQPVWRPGSPAGYDDIAASWAAPDALMRRVEVAQRLAAQRRQRDRCARARPAAAAGRL